MGGRAGQALVGGPGSGVPCLGAEPGGKGGWTRGSSADPSTGEPGGPGAGQRGVRGHLAARPRRREGCGRDWGNPGSRLESSGGELRAGPAIVSRGRTGRLRRLGISEAKHAHARRKVLAGRPGLSLLVPGPWAARGRAEDGEPKAPASQVRAAPCRRLHSSQTSF